jgi:8-oxo-dGTP pyrophosphatase MutT (NUDIX family)
MSESKINIEWLNQACFELDPNLSGTQGWIIFKDGTVLFYRRTSDAPVYPDKIDLIGGGAEPGETPFECFAREVLEETELNVTQDQVVAAQSHESIVHPGSMSWFFIVRANDYTFDDVVWGNEGVDPVAVPLAQALDGSLDLSPNIATRTEIYRPELERILAESKF